MSRRRERDPQVNLLRVYELIHQNITESLCQEVFGQVRRNERQRKWTLQALAEFWIAVTLDPPPALRAALAEALQKPQQELFPHAQAQPSSFFERCQNLRPEFFARLFEAFVQRAAATAPALYAGELQGLQERFTQVVLFDGSRLEEVAHRLKITWDERAVLLPGCLLGVYDLFRGHLAGLRFDADAAASESVRATQVVRDGCPGWRLQPGTLVMGDRLYCSPVFFAELAQKQAWGLFRLNRTVKLGQMKYLGSRRWEGGKIEEYRVQVGSGATAPIQTLRYICYQKHKRVFELLTNVLDRGKLSAAEALKLYRQRWSIERMYFDLKVVLNVNRFYAANPNAVAMQVYAAAIVYTAMRIAQAEAARHARVAPEEISPQKFFPRLAAAVCLWVQKEVTFREVQEANPSRRLRKPDWKRAPFAQARLRDIQRERRSAHRRRRRYCASRSRWKSFRHISGGKKFMRN